MMDLTLRYLRYHWRSNLAVLLCLTLASALLASLSSYATAVATRELNQCLEAAHPAERSLLITGTRRSFGEALYEDLQERLGEILKERVVIRHATLSADPQPSVEKEGRKRVVSRLDVYSFDKLPENVRLVEGRLPAQVDMNETVGNWPPPMEVVIGLRAAEQSGYRVGDRATASGMYHRLDIVGIVEPLDPDDDVWVGELGAFAVLTDTRGFGRDLGVGAIALPLIIAPESMQSYLGGPVLPHAVSWRITLHYDRIGSDRIETLHADLINFQTQSATRGAKTSTGLLQILADSLARLSRVRVALLLLTVQTLILVGYTLAMLTSFMVDRLQVELATLSARGASVWQITRALALVHLIPGFPVVLLLGSGLAVVAVRLWGNSTREVLPIRLSGEAWLLSGIAAGLGWLTLVLPVLIAARRSIFEPQPMRARPPQRSILHKRYVDLYLLVFGGLLYWQLNRSGSLVMRRLGNTQLADPLLLIGPTLLLIAVALVFLRIVPLLLRLAARFVQQRRGLVLSLGLLRPARDPLQPSRVVLLISLTAGLMLFARIFGDSLTHSQEALRSDALIQGIAGAFQLNAVALVLFSVTAFFLVHFFAAQGQGRDFGILSAMGLPARQWPTLSIVEGIVVLLLGLLAGTVVGFGLSYLMTPYLSQALVAPLAGSLAGVTIEQIVVDWPAVARLYAVLIALYGSALVLLWLVLPRARVRRALRMEDE
jgi:hypothetical protein